MGAEDGKSGEGAGVEVEIKQAKAPLIWDAVINGVAAGGTPSEGAASMGKRKVHSSSCQH